MAKRRPSGDGMVRKRDDGRWEGRIVVGHKENGEPIFQYVLVSTKKVPLAKLHQKSHLWQKSSPFQRGNWRMKTLLSNAWILY